MSNSSVNASSVILGYDVRTETISMISIGIFSFVSDLICMSTVFASRFKLIKTEFYILILIGLMDINDKLGVLFYFYVSLKFNLLYSSLSLSYSVLTNFCINMYLFYYSLFHLTSLSRSRLFLKLFQIVHKTQIFVIYSILILLISLTLTCSFSIVDYFYLKQFETDPLLFLKFFSSYSLRVLLQTLFPSVLSLVTYFLSIGFSLMRLKGKQSKHLSQSEMKSSRRNIILSVKFLFYAIINFISSFPVVIFCALFLFCPQCNLRDIRFLAYFGILSFIIKSIFLIFIHKILRDTFMKHFRDFFYCNN